LSLLSISKIVVVDIANRESIKIYTLLESEIVVRVLHIQILLVLFDLRGYHIFTNNIVILYIINYFVASLVK
jgi:hypothetical protein